MISRTVASWIKLAFVQRNVSSSTTAIFSG